MIVDVGGCERRDGMGMTALEFWLSTQKHARIHESRIQSSFRFRFEMALAHMSSLILIEEHRVVALHTRNTNILDAEGEVKLLFRCFKAALTLFRRYDIPRALRDFFSHEYERAAIYREDSDWLFVMLVIVRARE